MVVEVPLLVGVAVVIPHANLCTIISRTTFQIQHLVRTVGTSYDVTFDSPEGSVVAQYKMTGVQHSTGSIQAQLVV